jgi:hypothetical protein
MIFVYLSLISSESRVLGVEESNLNAHSSCKDAK